MRAVDVDEGVDTLVRVCDLYWGGSTTITSVRTISCNVKLEARRHVMVDGAVYSFAVCDCTLSTVIMPPMELSEVSEVSENIDLRL